MALEPEDRTEEIIGGTKPIEAVRSIAQSPRKQKGDCRMVVEFPFHFTKQFLAEKSVSDERPFPYVDGVDYLRTLKAQWEQGDIDLGDLAQMVIEHGDGALKMDAAK